MHHGLRSKMASMWNQRKKLSNSRKQRKQRGFEEDGKTGTLEMYLASIRRSKSKRPMSYSWGQIS